MAEQWPPSHETKILGSIPKKAKEQNKNKTKTKHYPHPSTTTRWWRSSTLPPRSFLFSPAQHLISLSFLPLQNCVFMPTCSWVLMRSEQDVLSQTRLDLRHRARGTSFSLSEMGGCLEERDLKALPGTRPCSASSEQSLLVIFYSSFRIWFKCFSMRFWLILLFQKSAICLFWIFQAQLFPYRSVEPYILCWSNKSGNGCMLELPFRVLGGCYHTEGSEKTAWSSFETGFV